MHCVAHREALAVSKAYDSTKYFRKAESLVTAIYGYFSRLVIMDKKISMIAGLTLSTRIHLQIYL